MYVCMYVCIYVREHIHNYLVKSVPPSPPLDISSFAPDAQISPFTLAGKTFDNLLNKGPARSSLS